MFRALLAAVKPALSQEFVIDFACSLAERHQLAIDACAVIDLARLAPVEPVPLGGGAFKTQRDEQRLATARDHAQQVLTRLEGVSRARGIKCHANVHEGDTATILAGAAQRCDLLVCGHSRGGDATERSLLHSILKHCPRPAIVVPQADYSTGQAVLVAYDGSAQSARALASFAVSGLATGRTVHIVALDDGSGVAEARAETAQAFLRRHGITSETQFGMRVKDVGSQILDEARRMSAGLVVMGAFGQNAVREFFFGSATRSLLNVLPIPVYMDH